MFCYTRGLAPSPKILTKVIRINSFGGEIFSHAQYLLSTWNDLKFLLAILLIIMCTTAQNHENIHILFIYPSIGRLMKKKTWGVPFNAQKLSVPYTLYRVFIAGFIMSFWVFSQSFWVTTLNLNIVKIEITTQKQFFSELLFISVADPGRFFLDLDPDPDLQIRF